mmetsp:Transcript_54734/g.155708  ORF Transcript_54734/g.155708 Transcript_54734/m.155708 type:complete len:262 (-) Transcript_54734:328-1113(-)
MMVTPPGVVKHSPLRVSAQLPPPTAARSMMTEPGFIIPTISSVMSSGDFRPGIAAVVMAMSHSLRCNANVSRCTRWNSCELSFAYPPAPEASSLKSTVTQRAPIDSTWSRTSRTSQARTTEPRAREVPMAARPATPQPRMKVCEGGNLPAAVISLWWKRPKLWAASRTARWPATLAWELSTSSFCAMVMRGAAVTSTSVTPAAVAFFTISFPASWRRATHEITILPRSLSKSSVGASIWKSTMAFCSTSALEARTWQPAAA